jgi:hypothetical protein
MYRNETRFDEQAGFGPIASFPQGREKRVG